MGVSPLDPPSFAAAVCCARTRPSPCAGSSWFCDDCEVEIEASYDRVAEDYAAQFSDELSRKPFDRKMLDWLLEKAPADAPLCDMGCGPGQVARYLTDRGAPACGIDLSGGMVACARRLHPGIPFEQGDMTALCAVADGAYGAIAAFYSIHHFTREERAKAFAEWHRVLAAGGALLAAFHVGEDVVHTGEWWGKPVSLDFYFCDRAEVVADLRAAGFAIEEVIERDPYPEAEYQSRRAYVFARKP